jgi:hypothetical protein
MQQQPEQQQQEQQQQQQQQQHSSSTLGGAGSGTPRQARPRTPPTPRGSGPDCLPVRVQPAARPGRKGRRSTAARATLSCHNQRDRDAELA